MIRFNKINWTFFEALISGPIYAVILLIIPFGMLTALSVVMDPSFIIYEFMPEELLFIPWTILSIFITLGNIRVAKICKNALGKKRIITLNESDADIYINKNSINILEGIANEIYIFIEKTEPKQIVNLIKKVETMELRLLLRMFRMKLYLWRCPVRPRACQAYKFTI